jgi:hypothetical protein
MNRFYPIFAAAFPAGGLLAPVTGPYRNSDVYAEKKAQFFLAAQAAMGKHVRQEKPHGHYNKCQEIQYGFHD